MDQEVIDVGADVMSLVPVYHELAQLKITQEDIRRLGEMYLPLVIKGLDDKAGQEAVHRGRIDIKTRRVAAQKILKKAREKANEYQKKVIGVEKQVLSWLEPIESHLEEEENRVNEERERIKREAEEMAAAVLRKRANALGGLGCNYVDEVYFYGTLKVPLALLKTCTDEQFDVFYLEIGAAMQRDREAMEAAEKTLREQREAAEKAQKEEAARLAKVAAEQEAERQRLVAEAKRLQDEKDRIEREKKEAEDAKVREENEIKRQAELKKATEEAAEKARIETEARIAMMEADKIAKEKAEAEEKVKKEEQARIKAERKAARLPDKQKLEVYVDGYFVGVDPPLSLKTVEGGTALAAIQAILKDAEKRIREIVEGL